MNIKKIVNLANPTNNEAAAKQKYDDEITETFDLFTFLSKYAPEVSSLKH